MNEARENLLGAWEDLPRRNFNVDAIAVELDSREAFVLTRVDGESSIIDLCSITGLGERDTIKHLLRLAQLELIIVEPTEGTRRLINMRTRQRSEGAIPEPSVSSFRGVSAQDADWLRQFGPLGFVPGRLYRGAGPSRYANMKFDQEALREAESLTVEFKKETLFLDTYLGRLDHYEFLGISATEDRKQLRKAYFEFSRRFHPDTVFRRDVGPYRVRIERIFKHGTEVYELMVGNAAFRKRYYGAVRERNRAIEAERDNDRVAQQKVRIGEKKKEAVGRKDALRERLRQNTEARSSNSRNKTVSTRLDKAKQFYDEGIVHFENESFMAAANALRLAANYDPKNGEYAAALALAEERMRTVKAEYQWKRGYIQESLGHISEALQAYLEAAEVLPRPEYCAHIADLFLKYDQDLHKAAELGKKAVDGDPRNVEFKLILGRIYQRAKLTKKAIIVFEQVLELEKSNEEAKKTLKKLR